LFLQVSIGPSIAVAPNSVCSQTSTTPRTLLANQILTPFSYDMMPVTDLIPLADEDEIYYLLGKDEKSFQNI
jgi:hypothetical protein